MAENSPFRSGFVALIGRPNSGKSTLLNTILGENLSPVTPMPQTTQRSIKGVFTTPEMQIVFTDTPGIHKGKYRLNEAMLRVAEQAVLASRPDCVCYLVDLSRDFGEEEQQVARIALSGGAPVLVVFNKSDLCKESAAKKAAFFKLFPRLAQSPCVTISAVDKKSREAFVTAVSPFIKEGPRYFDDDTLTDASMRFFAAEYLRKHIILNTREEVPHATFVEIERYRETDQGHRIDATIHVETTGQRGIIIGAKGALIERIRKAAERDMAQLAGCPVSISCHLKVSPDWRDNQQFLRYAFPE